MHSSVAFVSKQYFTSTVLSHAYSGKILKTLLRCNHPVPWHAIIGSAVYIFHNEISEKFILRSIQNDILVTH